MKDKTEVPGNVIQTRLNIERILLRVGSKLVNADNVFSSLDGEDIEITSLSVRLPAQDGGEYLMTIRAYVLGEAKVGFHVATTFYELLEGMVNRLSNRSVKWKVDKYAKDKD